MEGILEIGAIYLGLKSFLLMIQYLVLVTQSCLTLCDHMNYSLPGFSVSGISQARILSGLPFLPPGDLPNPGIKPRSPALAGGFFTTESPGKPFLFTFLDTSDITYKCQSESESPLSHVQFFATR